MILNNRNYIQNVFNIHFKLVRQFYCGSVLNSDHDHDNNLIVDLNPNDDDIKLSDEERDKLLNIVQELKLLVNKNKDDKTMDDSFDVFNLGISNENRILEETISDESDYNANINNLTTLLNKETNVVNPLNDPIIKKFLEPITSDNVSHGNDKVMNLMLLKNKLNGDFAGLINKINDSERHLPLNEDSVDSPDPIIKIENGKLIINLEKKWSTNTKII